MVFRAEVSERCSRSLRSWSSITKIKNWEYEEVLLKAFRSFFLTLRALLLFTKFLLIDSA